MKGGTTFHFIDADPVLTLDKRAWDAVIGTNLTGAFLTIKHAARMGPEYVATVGLRGPDPGQ